MTLVFFLQVVKVLCGKPGHSDFFSSFVMFDFLTAQLDEISKSLSAAALPFCEYDESHQTMSKLVGDNIKIPHTYWQRL